MALSELKVVPAVGMTIVIRYLTTGDLSFLFILCWPKKWINSNLLALVVGSTVCVRGGLSG